MQLENSQPVQSWIKKGLAQRAYGLPRRAREHKVLRPQFQSQASVNTPATRR